MTQIESIILSNNKGMSVTLCNLGARVSSIKLNIDGSATEMTVGHANLDNYKHDSFYLGATCGRVCNRISNAKFTLNGNRYNLSQNDGVNCLHGGSDNFSNRLWTINKNTLDEQHATLSLDSCNGDQGFPGNLQITVEFELTEENQLIIQYRGVTDAPTPINITNHSYFNLGETSCEALLLTINASNYLQSSASNTPTGKILSVLNSNFDFRNENCIGENQQQQIVKEKSSFQGFDHCMVLDKPSLQKPCAVLSSKSKKVTMSLFTDQPALQLYTGSYLSNGFTAYQGVCLEAQGFPDAVNVDHFPSTILRSGESYHKTIIYQFALL